jgi:methylated-DNA-[protein]-cysteine S-methyltransferase
MTKDYDAIIPAPFGAVGIKTQDDFLVEVDLLPEFKSVKPASSAFAATITNQIENYFTDPHSPLEIAYAVKGTHFQKRVWQAISSIPAGQVLTYSELAKKVNSGSRAVANVCGANQVPLFIPCHRVVAKKGLGGFMQGKANGLAIKQWLLDHENPMGNLDD